MTARATTKEKSLMVNTAKSKIGRDDGWGGSVKAVGGSDGGGERGASFGDIGGAEEEYVVEAFLENADKIEALVRTLLALELWRENVLFRRGHRRGHQRNLEIDNDEDGKEEIVDENEVIHLNEFDCGDNDYENDFVATSSISCKGEAGLAHRLATNSNTLRTAFILHVETTIVSLLNLLFYRGIPPELLSSQGKSGEDRSGSSGGDDVLLSLIDYCARQLVRFPLEL